MTGPRSLNVTAFGDTPDEVELSVLDQAREAVGSLPRLEIVPCYPVRFVSSAKERATGKAYRADVRVLVD
jgi:hypothetical protein